MREPTVSVGTFRGRVQETFLINHGDPRFVAIVTDIIGFPVAGMTVKLAGKSPKIQEVSGTSGFGGPVSTRSCLTGKPMSPTSALLLDWPRTVEAFHRLRVADVTEAAP